VPDCVDVPLLVHGFSKVFHCVLHHLQAGRGPS
jgi:hypothetical protein